MEPQPHIAVLGIVGLPARYGGFETLAEQLVQTAATAQQAHAVTVFCSTPQSPKPLARHFNGAPLRYVPLRANGVLSIPFDAICIATAAVLKHRHILVLGTSGAVAFPILRCLSTARLIVHVDGIEWQRPKWKGLARLYLRWAEKLAARWAHVVISDNAAISQHLRERYGIDPVEIAYGGEPEAAPADISDLALPPRYALAVARIEPENNIEMLLNAFATTKRPELPLVIVGNWSVSPASQALRRRFNDRPGLHLIDAVYDKARLRALREGASVYIHGHSAGGTNPALVEMMHIARPIAAFDCPFNRATTEDQASYFSDADSLRRLIPALLGPEGAAQADRLVAIAHRRYRWADITAQYFDLLGLPVPAPKASPRENSPL